MNMFTLSFKNKNLEEKWSYHRIHGKKHISVIGYIFMTLLNLTQLSRLFQHQGLNTQLSTFLICEVLGFIFIYKTFFQDQEQIKQIFHVFKKDVEFVVEKQDKHSMMSSYNGMTEEFSLDDFYKKLMRQRILRQKQYFFALTLVFNVNQLAHEVLDPLMSE